MEKQTNFRKCCIKENIYIFLLGKFWLFVAYYKCKTGKKISRVWIIASEMVIILPNRLKLLKCCFYNTKMVTWTIYIFHCNIFLGLILMGVEMYIAFCSAACVIIIPYTLMFLTGQCVSMMQFIYLVRNLHLINV